MERTFSIVPASNAPFIFIVGIGILFILLIGLFAFIGYSSRNAKFEVSEPGLRITGAIYGRFIPKETIISEGVAIINLNTSPEYRPRIRTNGIGLPGYSEGWFKLRNKEKALLFVTDRSKVVYVPTNQGYSVLLSVQDSAEFYKSTQLWR